MTQVYWRSGTVVICAALVAALLFGACGRGSEAQNNTSQTAEAAATETETTAAAEEPAAAETAGQTAGAETETTAAAEEPAAAETAGETGADARDGFVLSDIICWGDSLSVGSDDGVSYPGVLDSLLPDAVQVHNVSDSAGGENAITITCRSGAKNFVLQEDTVIPQPGESVPVRICAETGQWISLSRKNYDKIWPASIEEISGGIRLIQDTPPDMIFEFIPDEGQRFESFTAPAGTPVRFAIQDEYMQYSSAYPIIFIGQNGGFEGVDDLIGQQKAIIDTYGDGEHYLVMGFPAYVPDDRRRLRFAAESGEYETVEPEVRAGRDALEAAMKEAFGDRFLNVREYLSSEAMEDLGLTPNEEDLDQMSRGIVPQSLRAPGDDVHLNSDGYTALGRAVYERMCDLGDV